MKQIHVLRCPCAHVAMIRARRIVLRLLLLVWAHGHMAPCSQGQSTGTLRLFIEPGHDFQFVLDGRYRMQQREVTLAEGPHHFSFWAPKHRMIDTTVTVIANTVTSFMLRLPVSAEYMAFEREVAAYKRQVVLGRALPLTATIGFGAWSIVNFFQYRTAHEQLRDDEAMYASLTSPRTIAELKDVTLPADQDELAKQETELIISGALTVASAAATYWIFKRTKDRPVPRFEDREKVKFDGLVWVPSSTGGQWMAGLTIPLR